MNEQMITIWRLETDENDKPGVPENLRTAFTGPSSLIPFLNTADIQEDVMDLHDGTAYHFLYHRAPLPVWSVYIVKYVRTSSSWRTADLIPDDIAAAVFARSHYLNVEENDFANGQLISLGRAVSCFLMDEGEETWSRMCLELYNCLLNQACTYLNGYSDDMETRGGMRLMFVSREVKQRLETASPKVLPLELLIRDIAEDDAESRGLAIMSDNLWQFTAILPKETVQQLYALYLAEIQGS